MKIWLLLGWVTKVSPWSVFLHCTMPCIVMVSRIKQIFGGSFQWGTKTLSDLVREKGHCSFDETSNIKRSQWETFMSGVEKKNAIWILLNVLTSLCMGALYCLHRFSSTLTVLLEYWQFITTCDSLLFCLQEKIKPTVPIVHFKSAKPPFIICMKLVRRLGHLREWQFCSGNSCVSILDPEKE